MNTGKTANHTHQKLQLKILDLLGHYDPIKLDLTADSVDDNLIDLTPLPTKQSIICRNEIFVDAWIAP